MLRDIRDLHGATLHALNGEIGRVEDILFDDEYWTVRYLVVNTGSWLFGRKVLISPLAFGIFDWEERAIYVNLTREQVENSPGVETDAPVSRQWERSYYNYYTWPYYWGGVNGWGAYSNPGLMFSQQVGNNEKTRLDEEASPRYSDDVHLRSANEVTGYGITATDGHLGHVEGFIVNDETWRIGYIAVDTRDWWPGKKALVPPDWIQEMNWPDKAVTVYASREQIQNAPEWNPSESISPEFEDRLYHYYIAQHPLHREPIVV